MVSFFINVDITHTAYPPPQTIECLIALATVLRENNTLEAINVNRPLLWTVQEEPTDHFTRMIKVGQRSNLVGQSSN